jgi:hypothetical protein
LLGLQVFTSVISRGITTSQLEGRFKAVSYDGEYAQDENGDILDSDGNTIIVNSVEEQAVKITDPEQKKLLIN